jgi:hypothetical protein
MVAGSTFAAFTAATGERDDADATEELPEEPNDRTEGAARCP